MELIELKIAAIFIFLLLVEVARWIDDRHHYMMYESIWSPLFDIPEEVLDWQLHGVVMGKEALLEFDKLLKEEYGKPIIDDKDV